MLDKGDIQKMQGSGASRTGLGTTALEENAVQTEFKMMLQHLDVKLI